MKVRLGIIFDLIGILACLFYICISVRYDLSLVTHVIFFVSMIVYFIITILIGKYLIH